MLEPIPLILEVLWREISSKKIGKKMNDEMTERMRMIEPITLILEVLQFIGRACLALLLN